MEYTTLGRTGLRVSVAGLGCGGFSRLGQSAGRSVEESVAVVRQALDLGINFVDTAAGYHTEPIVGKALQGVGRDTVVLSTKASIAKDDKRESPAQIVSSLDQSLKNLRVDCIDVFHLHGVEARDCDYACDEIVPAVLRERDRGKFRFLGITEIPPHDPGHESLVQALPTNLFDVTMVAYHMLHQSARRLILPLAVEKNVGVLIMFAVRVIFSAPGWLQRVVGELVESGHLPPELKDDPEPLGFLLRDGNARSVIDAAYRYCRHTPGTDVVLFGTGDPDHVRANVESILSPPLPPAHVQKLEALFGALTDVGLDLPAPVDEG